MHTPELFHWNESVHYTPIDRALGKCDSKRGRAAFYVQLFLIYGRFSRIIVLFLDKINAKIWEDFEQFFVTKHGFFASESTKKLALSTMAIQHIFNKS